MTQDQPGPDIRLRTDAEFTQYITSVWLPGATTAAATTMHQLYPNDITAGSPFDTSILNAATSQFKRLAAFQVNYLEYCLLRIPLIVHMQGDAVFQAPRRFFQQSRSGKQKQWGFCGSFLYSSSLRVSSSASIVSKRLKGIPFLGSVSFSTGH